MGKRATITSPYVPDMGELRGWLEKMVASMKLVELVVAVVALVTRMRDINLELMKQVASMRRARPRSERLAFLERQLALPLGLELKPKPSDDRKPDDEKKKSRKGRHPGRAPLPPHLPRIPVSNPVPPEMRICPQCGSEMTTVGHSTCEILELIPARFVVIQRQDERVACPHDDTIVTAPTPPQLIERGKLGTTLVVEAMADKFLEHMPIERQSTKAQRAGVSIAPQTLGRGVGAGIDLLAPVADCIHEQTRGPGLLGMDTSAMPVLDPEVLEGIRNGSMACWTNARWVSFVYSPSGDANSMKAFLGVNYARTVQCDGTSITNFIETAGGKRPGCWSHARSKLVKAARSGEKLAFDGVRIIAELFAIEKASALAGENANERKARRREQSKPVLDRIEAWAAEQREIITPKSTFGKALGYMKNQWKRLCLFLDDGNIELTNNRRERELRKLVLGRKNWLFSWKDYGGRRTADILTIVATCIAHDVNPRAYLHLVTRLIIEGWPQSTLRDLLPDRIVLAHPELALRPVHDD